MHLFRIIKNKFTYNHFTRPKLGRWSTTDNKDKKELKIYYANQDHCGVCVEAPVFNKENRFEDIEEEYYKTFTI